MKTEIVSDIHYCYFVAFKLFNKTKYFGLRMLHINLTYYI